MPSFQNVGQSYQINDQNQTPFYQNTLPPQHNIFNQSMNTQHPGYYPYNFQSQGYNPSEMAGGMNPQMMNNVGASYQPNFSVPGSAMPFHPFLQSNPSQGSCLFYKSSWSTSEFRQSWV